MMTMLTRLREAIIAWLCRRTVPPVACLTASTDGFLEEVGALRAMIADDNENVG